MKHYCFQRCYINERNRFDDAEFLSNIPQRKILSNLYVQAVQEPLQHELLYEYKEKVFPEKVRFGGVKIMVDGVVADSSGDIYGVYQSGVASPEIDYEAIKAEVAAFNEVEIPCCLTTEGDKAGYKAASILVEFGKRLPEGVLIRLVIWKWLLKRQQKK